MKVQFMQNLMKLDISDNHNSMFEFVRLKYNLEIVDFVNQQQHHTDNIINMFMKADGSLDTDGLINFMSKRKDEYTFIIFDKEGAMHRLELNENTIQMLGKDNYSYTLIDMETYKRVFEYQEKHSPRAGYRVGGKKVSKDTWADAKLAGDETATRIPYDKMLEYKFFNQTTKGALIT